MYDELVKALRRLCDWSVMDFEDNLSYANQIAEEAADAIEELGRLNAEITRRELKLRMEKPRWIPVTERLLEHEYGESASALTIDLYGVMRVTYFDGGNWCWPSGEALTTMRIAPITHWMPLPQPPKEEK